MKTEPTEAPETDRVAERVDAVIALFGEALAFRRALPERAEIIAQGYEGEDYDAALFGVGTILAGFGALRQLEPSAQTRILFAGTLALTGTPEDEQRAVYGRFVLERMLDDLKDTLGRAEKKDGRHEA